MPLSRDPRNDRRRRVLREASSPESSDQGARGKQSSASRRSAEEDSTTTRRSAGYSQEVRKACGQRLVQLIPVRPLSFLAVCLVSLVVPGTLMLFHYMIYVSGSLQWYGQPLAVALDASHPSSIAAWFGSHLWLLCLAATVLTFQLRRHKLDDYRGEYRLWFWLVLTCLLASVDSTTHLTELLGLAIDPWSRAKLGLSGPAFTTSTLAVMIGMLGLRLCSELKTVPMSLIFWLAGICAWAGSGALAQEELQLKMTLQFRIWLKSALWLGGLTAVWLAAISYLRAVYREAQQRFLSRTRMINAKLARSDKDSQTTADGRRRKFGLPSFVRSDPQAEEKSSAVPRERKDRASTAEQVRSEKNKALKQTNKDDSEATPKSGLGRFFQRKSETSPAGNDGTQKKQTPAGSDHQDKDEQSEGKPKKRFSKWLRPPKDDDEAQEYQKVPRRKADRDTGKKIDAKAKDQPEDVKSTSNGGWFKRKPQKQPAATKNPSTGKKWFSKGESANGSDGQSKQAAKKSGGLFAKFKLQPPDDSTTKPDKTVQSGQKNVPQSKQQPAAKEAESPNNSSRPLTKAERRRMRRLQQKQNRAA